MRAYCTYFDRHYLVKAMALFDSLARHEPGEYRIFAVCMDELSRIVLTKLAIPHVTPVPAHQIEAGDAALLAAKQTRPVVEYYWTATPTIILRLLEQYPTIEVLTYLDADLYFFSSPQPLFDELGRQSILIHGHRFSPAQAYLGEHNGRYNVGLLCFRRDAHGLEALRWWRARCLDWCAARYEDGKMGDQMYLNDWPTRFSGVVELQHIGGGIGPWNHEQYALGEGDGGQVSVNGVPAIFYHFHSFTTIHPDVIMPVKHPHYPLTLRLLSLLFLPYARALSQAAMAVQAVLPEFSDWVTPSAAITPRVTFLARRIRADELAARHLPHHRVALTPEWDCYCSAQVLDAPGGSARQGTASDSLPVAEASLNGQAGHPVPARTTTPVLPAGDQLTLDDVLKLLLSVSESSASLQGRLQRCQGGPDAFAAVIREWVEECTRAGAAPLGSTWQQMDLREVAHLPERFRLATGYVRDRLLAILEWLCSSRETTNLTYDLTALNTLHLAWVVAHVTGTDVGIVRRYINELEADDQLRRHVRDVTQASERHLTADAQARYGRRAGWYALVRITKPRVVVETGVDKGLGTCVLAAALMKNRAEGVPGSLYATDLDPNAGYLFTAPYDQVGTILYGDSIQTLRTLTHTVDLFIADSAHTAPYERGEYAAIQSKLSDRAILVSDNAHVTPELAAFATETGRRFLYFHEQPASHFYPGAGMGVAFVPAAASEFRAPVSLEKQHGGIVNAQTMNAHETTRPLPISLPHAPAPASATSGTPSRDGAPLVSVIISAYNAEAFIWECLEDVERQTIAERLEILVVDAASPQHERAVVEAFQQRYRNITYLRTPERIGVYAAWNLAVKVARGKYVTPFSTNDRLRPDAYALLAKALEEHPQIALVYGDTYLTRIPHETFERHTRAGEWRWPDYRYDDLLEGCLVGPHPMWRRAIHDAIGYFDETYRALGDQEFWLRMGESHQLLHIPVVTGLYWHSPEGLSNQPALAQPEERRLRTRYQSRRKAPRAGSIPDTPTQTPDVQIALAKHALKQGQWDETERHLAALLARDPGLPEAWMVQGVLAMQRQDPVRALAAFETVLRSRRDRDALMGKGFTLVELAQPASAWTCFTEVLLEHPDDADAIHWLLRVGTTLERWDALATALDAFVARNPDRPAERYALAAVYLRLKQVPNAERELTALRLLWPDYDGLEALEQALAVATPRDLGTNDEGLPLDPAPQAWAAAGPP